MQGLEQFEELVERLLEGSFARLFRSPVHPVELARRLERALEAEKRVGVLGVVAPNRYTVRMSEVDFAGMSPVQGVERELAQLVSSLAHKRGYLLSSHVVVTITPDTQLPPQSVQVAAAISDRAVAADPPEPGGVWQGTMVLPVQRVQQRARPVAAMVRRDGHGAERTYLLDRRLITIGRSLENNIVLEDARVSRHHAQLRLIGDQFCVLDLGSTNGTFVNGRKIREQVIGPGDEVSFGGIPLVYRRVE